jgi:alanyl-tRNA synthetase
MASQRLYHEDAYATRFRARVVAAGEHRGRPAVELEATCFYPEGGGQCGDRGTLGRARIVDVQVDDDGRIWHVFEGPEPPAGELDAEVDWVRRFDAMQQHTGQHILSAALERIAAAPTLSSTLGEERSVVEVDLAAADWRLVERVEEAANRVVWEDRPVVLHWVEPGDVARFRLRKLPAVSGRVRVVEVPDWDASACGGTHTRRTGEVGAIKIVRWERVRTHVRFEFLCGARAWRDHAWRTEELVEAGRRRTLKDREVIAQLERAAAERDELKKGLAALTTRLIAAEARDRVGDPPAGLALFDAQRARDEVRLLALKALEAGAPWVAVGAAAPDPVVMVGTARTAPGGAPRADARTLLPGLLERAEGKGGGSPDLVQVAARDGERAEAAWRWAIDALRGATEGT